MEQNAQEEFHLQVHQDLEAREASLEFQELTKSTCKFCGQKEFMYRLCEKCYSEHRMDVLSKISLIIGWLITAGATSFAVNNIGAFVVSLGLSGGVFMFHLCKILVSKTSAPIKQ